ncbi:MAG: SGNH/GDSL hydrolase family protein [Pyrinomonadaceae bacterium]
MVICGLLCGLLIAEIALRLVGYTYPVFYTPDDVRGYALRPGAEGWYRKEGEAYVRINGEGLRDRERAKAKPANTLRVAVVGDSYAEALQVPAEKGFCALLEQKLKECGAVSGRDVEVINFGVSGYGTAQELLTLRGQVWDYSPEVVVLAVTTNNDITDNSRALKKTEEVPYFVRRDEQLVLDDSFRETVAFRLRQSTLNKAGRWIRDHARVIQLIHQAHYAAKKQLALMRARPASPGPEQRRDAASEAEELGIDNLIYRPPGDPVWEDAWLVTEGLIALMSEEVRDRGAEFLVVTMSSGIQVHPDPSARQAFARRLGVEDLLYADRRIGALCDRRGIKSLNLAPQLQAYAEQNKVFLHGFGDQIGNGHWNGAGHRVAGELIAPKLCEMITK